MFNAWDLYSAKVKKKKKRSAAAAGGGGRGRSTSSNSSSEREVTATEERTRHSRRIYTEQKAKVVVAVLGTECIQILVALAILHQDDLKNRMNSSFSLYHPGAIHSFVHIILVPNS